MNRSHLRLPVVGLVSALALVAVTSAAFAAGVTPGSIGVPAAPQASGHAPSVVPPALPSVVPTNEATDEPTAGATDAATSPAGHAVVFGVVTALGAGSVTIEEMNGTTREIDLTDSTVYMQGGATVTSDALVVGARILAKGTISEGAFTATSIRIVPSVVIGTVTSMTSDTLVVETPAGESVTIKVTSATQFSVPGVASASLADLAAGDRVAAFGTMGSDGVLAAAFVAAVDGSNSGFPGLGGLFGNGNSGGNGGGNGGGNPGGVSASHVPSPFPTPRA